MDIQTLRRLLKSEYFEPSTIKVAIFAESKFDQVSVPLEESLVLLEAKERERIDKKFEMNKKQRLEAVE